MMKKTSVLIKTTLGITCSIILLLALVASGFSQKLDMEKFSAMKPRSIGPAGMSGRVTAIDVVRNNPNVIYAGTASGGIWKSETGGLNWEPIFDKEKVLSIGSIAINPDNADEIWAGTGEGNPRNSLNGGYGLYKSIDGGKTWKCMGLEKTRNIHRIIINPQNTDIIYIGAIGSPWGDSEDRGVYKTSNSGESWEKVLYIDEKTGPGDMVMDPENPNKLIVGMWEHRRWPWFFKSGGKSSGIFITYNGAKDWKKLSSKDGLPEGDIGRVGLAIAPSDGNRVYAWVESKENAMYRSNNGGENWRKVATEGIGNRPFYYADIFVDTKDPDRIYSLYSGVSKSEDGGLTFQSFMRGIHPDHHSWYIHPDDPDFMIDGNDGGMAITHDRGATWYMVKSLPLGQFYHINVDMDLPYHVMGGLQDNGSWRGPAYIWQRGGINNMYWDNLMGGDGFDVVPDSSNSRFGYAMSQGGSLGRYDALTGHTKRIRPTHPEGKKLRFHWNAAIAHDPFDNTTIYYGSQYLHKSYDRGNNWDVISPDLTTNDPEKQKYDKSGGITIDATGAENHTTIISIAPSPVQKDVIWVGTDDGNVQLTKDGGETWTNMTKKFKNIPECSWVPQIHSSSHNAGEAWVVINNYRRNDFKPYLMYTNNFGKSWEQKTDESQIWGYNLCVVQDPVEPNLVFLGTIFGMYFSIDKGDTWTQWTNAYPNVSTMDMVIHPREHDLVIGTFGRAIYILDDISPLRHLASQGVGILEKEVHAFDIPDAYMINQKSAPGYYSPGHGGFSGENKASGAIISYSVKELIKRKRAARDENQQNAGMAARAERFRARAGGNMPAGMRGMRGQAGNNNTEAVKIEILDSNGKIVKNMTHTPLVGINRTSWNFDENATTRLGATAQSGQSGSGSGFGRNRGGGTRVLPGKYTVNISYGGKTETSTVNVKMDPRIEFSMDDLIAQRELNSAIQKHVVVLNKAIDRIRLAQEAVTAIEAQLPKGRQAREAKEIIDKTKAVKDTLTSIMGKVMSTGSQGRRGGGNNISSNMRSISSAIFGGYEAPGRDIKILFTRTEEKIIEFLDIYNNFFETDWPKYKEYVNNANLSPFKDKNFEILKIK